MQGMGCRRRRYFRAFAAGSWTGKHYNAAETRTALRGGAVPRSFLHLIISLTRSPQIRFSARSPSTHPRMNAARGRRGCHRAPSKQRGPVTLGKRRGSSKPLRIRGNTVRERSRSSPEKDAMQQQASLGTRPGYGNAENPKPKAPSEPDLNPSPPAVEIRPKGDSSHHWGTCPHLTSSSTPLGTPFVACPPRTPGLTGSEGVERWPGSPECGVVWLMWCAGPPPWGARSRPYTQVGDCRCDFAFLPPLAVAQRPPAL